MSIFNVSLTSTEKFPASFSMETGVKRKVVFKVSPDVSESRSVNYKTLEPIHMPGGIYVYGNSTSRQIQLSNVRLIARTIDEATDVMRTLHTLRGWTTPYFGVSSTFQTTGTGKSNEKTKTSKNLKNGTTPPPVTSDDDARLRNNGYSSLGTPPNVLLLNAYSPNNIVPGQPKPFPTHLQNIPVVITSLSIPYPSDVDYIPDENGQPVPRIMTIDIQLVETHSPREYEKFDLQAYREGRLTGF